MHRFLARLGFTPLVLRRVVATSTLRRRLAGESKRSALEDLLSRRRSLRARAVRAATPPHGLALDVAEAPVVPVVPVVAAVDVDLPPPSVADTLELEVQLEVTPDVQIEVRPVDVPVIVPVPVTPPSHAASRGRRRGAPGGRRARRRAGNRAGDVHLHLRLTPGPAVRPEVSAVRRWWRIG